VAGCRGHGSRRIIRLLLANHQKAGEMIDQNLKQYATDSQWLDILAIDKHGSTENAAKALSKDAGNIRKSLRRVKEKAAKQGYSPEHDMTHHVVDGFKAKGISTLYGADGEVKVQWVKTMADNARQLEMIMEKFDEGVINFKPFKPTPKPKRVEHDYLTQVTITDFHMGMYACAAETGDDWDIRIAQQVFLNSIHDMIEASPPSGIGVLNQLGDFVHFDGLLAITSASGHILDADTRYSKLVDLVMCVMAEAVRMMLKKFEKVVVIQAEGNHDPAGSIWLRKFIKYMFVNDPRVEVIDNDFPYYAYLFGENMLAYHHAHKKNMAQLAKLFSMDPRFRAMWGQAVHTYIHCGHLHHEKVIDDGGATTTQHPTLSGRDAYAARGGFMSQRGALVHVYHKTEGQVSMHTVRPRSEK